jgi:putative addiction module component (TIGR02574 family)
MNRNTAKVIGDALALPPRSRARLADKLLESLDQPRQKAIDKLWADEVEARIDAYEKGEIKVISGKDIFRELRFKKRRAIDRRTSVACTLPMSPCR